MGMCMSCDGCPSKVSTGRGRVLWFQTQLQIKLHSPFGKAVPPWRLNEFPYRLSHTEAPSQLLPRAFVSGSYLAMWLGNCVCPLGKWTKMLFLSKVIPTIALNSLKSPDFDQGPCPKDLGTVHITCFWQCLQRTHLSKAASAWREAAFECPVSSLLPWIKSMLCTWLNGHLNGRWFPPPQVSFLRLLPLINALLLFLLPVLFLGLDQCVLSTTDWTGYNLSLLIQKKKNTGVLCWCGKSRFSPTPAHLGTVLSLQYIRNGSSDSVQVNWSVLVFLSKQGSFFPCYI